MSLAAGSGWAAARPALAFLSLAAGVASLLSVAVAMWAGRSGRIDWSFAENGLLGALSPGFAGAALLAAAAAAVLALTSGSRSGLAPAIVGALLGAGVLVGLGARQATLKRQALLGPPVHDVATDWRDPLMPTAALLHRRGPDALPIEAAPALSEGPRGGFLGRPVAEVNASTCPQAQPLVLALGRSAAYARMEAASLAAGLHLVTDDPSAGVLEAEAPAPLAYGGRADVLARVRGEGEGARIDLRAISRHGQVDGGTNCRRVLTLRAAIAAGARGVGR